MVDVQYSDFESRFYALPVCWYKKLTMFSYLIAVTCMNEYKWFNSSRNDANQRSRRLEMPWLNIQRHWTFFHSLIQTISLLRYRNRKTTQYVLTKHLKPICIRQIRTKKSLDCLLFLTLLVHWGAVALLSQSSLSCSDCLAIPIASARLRERVDYLLIYKTLWSFKLNPCL